MKQNQTFRETIIDDFMSHSIAWWLLCIWQMRFKKIIIITMHHKQPT